METKICTKCLQIKPETHEYFTRDKKGKNGFSAKCKECRKIYRSENKEQSAIIKKKWDIDNEEHKKEYKKQWDIKNKDRLKIYRKEYANLNKEYKKEYMKNWRLNNLELHLERSRRWRENNKALAAKSNKKYKESHRENYVINEQKREALKRNLPITLTADQWNEIKQAFNNSCCYCGRTLPLEQEHFIPLSKMGELSKNNIICACKSCNSSKGNRDFFTWYPKHKSYSRDREKKILSFLNYKDGIQQLSMI